MADQEWKVAYGGHRYGGIAYGRPPLLSLVGALVVRPKASYSPIITANASYTTTIAKAGRVG